MKRSTHMAKAAFLSAGKSVNWGPPPESSLFQSSMCGCSFVRPVASRPGAALALASSHSGWPFSRSSRRSQAKMPKGRMESVPSFVSFQSWYVLAKLPGS